jgi:hypothetical protein
MALPVIVPVEPVPAPVAPVVPPVAPPQQPTPDPVTPEGFVEKARFSGAIRKINDLTGEKDALQLAIDEKASELERLRNQMAEQGLEHTTLLSARDATLQERITAEQATAKELADMRMYKRKVEMAKALGHPDLIAIIDTIPNMDSDEALQKVMEDVVGFTNSKVQAREQELLAGVMPLPPALQIVPDKPSTQEGWQRHIETLEMGSSERQKATDDWHKWGVEGGWS